MITSRLDTDFYKFRMSLFAFHYYPHVEVDMEFTSRDKDFVLTEKLAESILARCAEIRRGLHYDGDSWFHFLDEELNYVEKMIGVSASVSETWLDLLQSVDLPMPYFDRGKIKVSGPWWLTMFWETYIMSTHSELVSKMAWGQPGVYNLGTPTQEDVLHEKLQVKLNILSAVGNLHIVDFGTRRRYSSDWQRKVLCSSLGLIEGTSNTLLAMELKLPVVGSMAHEVFMVPEALLSENQVTRDAASMLVMQQWEQLYGPVTTIALTDTFRTEQFVKTATSEQMRRWGGFRHDSGDAYYWYLQIADSIHGKQPFKPKLVFSDALKIEDILRINHFVDKDRFDAVFGWGTNLTNDFGQKPPSTIMKVVSANGRSTVKLSDVMSKALGAPERLLAYRKI